MKRAVAGIFGPFTKSFNELKRFRGMWKGSSSKKEKSKYVSMIYFHGMFLFIFSVLFIYAFSTVILGITYDWRGFLALIILVPAYFVFRALQKRILTRTDTFLGK